MAEAKAEPIIAAEWRRRKRTKETLKLRRQGDFGKVALAAKLREETVVTVAWIAARLRRGTVGHLNNWLYRWRKGQLLD